MAGKRTHYVFILVVLVLILFILVVIFLIFVVVSTVSGRSGVFVLVVALGRRTAGIGLDILIVIVVVILCLVVVLIVFAFIIGGYSRGRVEIILVVRGIAKVLVKERHCEGCCVESATPRR